MTLTSRHHDVVSKGAKRTPRSSRPRAAAKANGGPNQEGGCDCVQGESSRSLPNQSRPRTDWGVLGHASFRCRAAAAGTSGSGRTWQVCAPTKGACRTPRRRKWCRVLRALEPRSRRRRETPQRRLTCSWPSGRAVTRHHHSSLLQSYLEEICSVSRANPCCRTPTSAPARLAGGRRGRSEPTSGCVHGGQVLDDTAAVRRWDTNKKSAVPVTRAAKTPATKRMTASSAWLCTDQKCS